MIFIRKFRKRRIGPSSKRVTLPVSCDLCGRERQGKDRVSQSEPVGVRKAAGQGHSFEGGGALVGRRKQVGNSIALINVL